MKLKGKIFIKGKIELLTGLSIGGSSTDLVIGGIDNNVIKNSAGTPYIPGSSIKGKMRSLIELKEKGELCICGGKEKDCDICAIFGAGANVRSQNIGPTRAIVRDASLNKVSKENMEEKKGEFQELELIYTEGKWENSINRKTSEATPRQMERVPAGAKFDLDIVFNILEDKDIDRFYKLVMALELLKDDYLGGSGSRGYGRIDFLDLEIKMKLAKDYEEGNEAKLILSGKNIGEINREKETIKTELKKLMNIEG